MNVLIRDVIAPHNRAIQQRKSTRITSTGGYRMPTFAGTMSGYRGVPEAPISCLSVMPRYKKAGPRREQSGYESGVCKFSGPVPYDMLCFWGAALTNLAARS